MTFFTFYAVRSSVWSCGQVLGTPHRLVGRLLFRSEGSASYWYYVCIYGVLGFGLRIGLGSVSSRCSQSLNFFLLQFFTLHYSMSAEFHQCYFCPLMQDVN